MFVFIHQEESFILYFGNSQNSLSMREIDPKENFLRILDVQKKVDAHQTVFLHQNHGTAGFFLDDTDNQTYFLDKIGDYIFTKKTGVGIGVLTADCLPIIIYDPKRHATCIIHAGWKGLVAGVFQVGLQAMVKEFQTDMHFLEIYLGPAARSCCYQVQQDFIDAFIDYKSDFSSFFINKNEKTYFDNQFFIMVIARNLGIDVEKIYTKYNVCTICNLSFCSYRRENNKARRQISMICLR